MEELRRKVKERFAIYHAGAHDFKHASRTSKLARKIALAEGYDPEEAELAGLLHDMGRTIKDLKDTHAHEGAPIARELLDQYTDLSDEAKDRIEKAVYFHSDKETTGMLNNIVQDADKLDGMGAVGICRAYIAPPKGIDYDPNDIIPTGHDYYKLQNAHELIIMELAWYSMLYTDEGKSIGKPRYEFAKKFLEEFKREVEESS